MRKGFTLIELLIVIFVLSMLGMTAIYSYYGSQSTLSFLVQFREVMSAVNMSRHNALGNVMVENKNVERFGVSISQEAVVVFADNGLTANKYDAEGDDDNSGPDTLLKKISLDSSKYVFISNQKNPPTTLFYESVTGKFSAYDSTGNRITDKYISFTMTNKKDSTQRHILIFQVSGLAEEVKTLPQQQ